jgi:hypothetical protein
VEINEKPTSKLDIWYSYPQPPSQNAAPGPGSIFNQQGGSIFNQREHRAKLRLMVKRILRKYKYPPDQQEEAIRTVLQQAEGLSAEWV